MDRRSFLTALGTLAGTAAWSPWSQAAGAGDYKALVAVFLYGGNDANNTLVPLDATRYAQYATARGPLALAQSSLLPLVDASGSAHYGLHPALGGASGLQGLWDRSRLAWVANVGPLVVPTTRAQVLANSVPLPANLYSHIDQQHAWESAEASGGATTGWGGRLLDQISALNSAAVVPPLVSLAGTNLYLTAQATRSLALPETGSFGLSGFGTGSADVLRRATLSQLLGVDRSATLVGAADDALQGAIASTATIGPILSAATASVDAAFAGLSGHFAAQLGRVARLIEARASLGVRRQVFLVSLGSFDTHTDQLATQQSLYTELGAGLSAFHAAMDGIGIGNGVTSFTFSDFSRTLKPNSTGGTDHAWGGHHLVAGGAVRGRSVYGTFPTLVLGGPDDAGSEGRFVPTTATDQYAATLGAWFGLSAAQQAAAFPHVGQYASPTLGFV
jgi:uncharacterized protein (DUF1501 family)